MVKLLLIGAGQWGKKYISTLNNIPDIILDIADRYSWKDLIDQKPDGVIVCTPPQSHIEIAQYSLSCQIPTMIEKPLSLSLDEAKVLQQYSIPILVNHIHLFSDQYQVIKQNLISQNISWMTSYGCSDRIARDYSELWDYGSHDIAMSLDLAQRFPKQIRCEEICPRRFCITLYFDGFQSVHTVGHIDKGKERNLVVSDGQIYEYEDINNHPLNNALKVFIGAINGKPDYRLGLDLSYQVLRVLKLCEQSLYQQNIIKV